MSPVILLLLAPLLPGVLGVCDPAVLAAIAKLWPDQKPPSADTILDNIRGTMTLMFVPAYVRETPQVSGLLGMQTVVEGDPPNLKGRDVAFYKTGPVEDPFDVEVESGVIRQVYNRGETTEMKVEMHVAVLENGVLGFYQCLPICKPELAGGFDCAKMDFVSIAIRDWANTEEQRAGYVAAREKMKPLGLNFPEEAPLGCPPPA